MNGYTKLFTSILASTIWREDDKTRLVWITMLAMSGKDGVVEGSIPGLADFAKVSIEDCEMALKKLMEPDPYSRSKEHEGRRIEEVDGGWLILNRSKYREKMGSDERRAYKAAKQREYREKKRRLESGQRGHQVDNDSTNGQNGHSTEQSIAEQSKVQRRKSTLEGESEGKGDSTPEPKMKIPPDRGDVIAYAKEIDLTTFDAVEFMDYHTTYNWSNGKKGKIRDWKAALRTWKRNKAKYAPKGGKTPHSSNLRRTDSKWDDLENQENES